MAKVPEVRIGPIATPKDLQQAIQKIEQALNDLIRQFNLTQGG